MISSCIYLFERGQHLLMLCKYVLQARMTFCLCSSMLSFMLTPLSWLLIWSTSSASECTAGWCQSLHTSLHSWCVFNFHAVTFQSCHAAICQTIDGLSSCNCDYSLKADQSCCSTDIPQRSVACSGVPAGINIKS